jgi:hypothetical protein
MTILEEKINKLPDDLKKEASDFVDFLLEKKMKTNISQKRPIGLAKGKFKMKDDFQSPLSESELKQLGFL